MSHEKHQPTPEEIAREEKNIVYDGGYIRLTTGGRRADACIEIDNPQESLIKQIIVDRDIISNEIYTYFLPHRKDVESLTKIYNALCNAGTNQGLNDLPEPIGLRPNGVITYPQGVIVYAMGINDDYTTMFYSNNKKLKEYRILGKNEMYANAVLNTLVEANTAFQNGLFEADPDTKRNLMQNVGRDLQTIYQREHSGRA